MSTTGRRTAHGARREPVRSGRPGHLEGCPFSVLGPFAGTGRKGLHDDRWGRSSAGHRRW
jgi:hypothetical protein